MAKQQARPKPHVLSWPLTPATVENLDEMLDILFKALRSGIIFPATTEGDLIYWHGGKMDRLAVGANHTVLKSNGTDPIYAAVDLTADVTGLLPVASGGTGIGSYTVGDLIYASTSAVLSKLADVAAGKYLRSGGVGVAPVWSTLQLPNAATIGDLLIATSTNVMTMLSAGTLGQVLTAQGAGVAPIWATAASGTGGEPLTNGDATLPELVFDSLGDVIMVS